MYYCHYYYCCCLAFSNTKCFHSIITNRYKQTVIALTKLNLHPAAWNGEVKWNLNAANFWFLLCVCSESTCGWTHQGIFLLDRPEHAKELNQLRVAPARVVRRRWHVMSHDNNPSDSLMLLISLPFYFFHNSVDHNIFIML